MTNNPFAGLDRNNPEDIIKAAEMVGVTRYDLRRMSPKVNEYLSGGSAQQTKQEDQPGVISDLWSSFGVGAGNLVKAAGSLYGLATGDMDNGATRLGGVVTDYWQKEKSNVLKELEQGRKEAITNSDSELGSFGNAIWETVSNPRLFASFVSEQIPMFVAPGGAGAAGAKAGASYAAKKGTQVAAQRFGSKVGTGVGVGVGAAMQGGDVGANTYDDLIALPEPIWEQNPEYLSLKDQLGDAQKAKEQIALSYGRKASAIAGTLSVGSQFIPGGATVEKAMAGNKFTGGLMGRVAKGFAGEGAQEIIEEGGGKVISNSLVNNIDESRGTFEGVGESSGLAIIGGGVMGGTMAAISGEQDVETVKKQYEAQLNQLRTAGKKAVAEGDLKAAEQIDEDFKKARANYNDYLKFYDPNFVKTNVNKQQQAKENAAAQGGDALDQANAASSVASSIADDVASDNEVRIQREREAQSSPMQVWQPNFTMPGSETEQAQQVDGEYIANTDFPNSVPLGNTLGFDESVGAIDAMPENRVGQSDTIFTGEQREELPAPQRLGLPDKYTNTIQGQDRTTELDAQEQMRQAQNAPRQIEQKDIIFGEDNRFRVGTDRATIRSNGNPFPTVKSVQASRSYRNAIEQGITPEIVKVGNGFGWETSEDIDAPQSEAQASAIEAPVQEVAQPTTQELVSNNELNELENNLEQERKDLVDGTPLKIRTKEQNLIYDVSVLSVINADNEATDKMLDDAIALGREDIAEIVVGRAERHADQISTTPGVPESSPKYAEIKLNLETRKKKEQEAAKKLRQKLNASKGSKKEEVAQPTTQEETPQRTASLLDTGRKGQSESPAQDNQGDLFNVEDNIGGRTQGESPSGNDTLTEDNQSLREPESQEVATQEPPQGGFFTPDESIKEDPTPNNQEDWGEEIKTARKNISVKWSENSTDDEISTKPLSKTWPENEFDEVGDSFASAFAFAARAEIPRKPNQPHKKQRWVEKVKNYRQLVKDNVVDGLLSGNMTSEQLREKAEKYSLSDFFAKVDVLNKLDRQHWGKVERVQTYPDAKEPTTYVRINGRNREVSSTDPQVIAEQIKPFLEEVADKPQMKFEVRGSKGRYYVNKTGDPEYTPLATFETSKEAFDFKRDNNNKLVEAWESHKQRVNVTKSDMRNKVNKPRTGEDYRQGKNATAEDFQEKFGIKRGTFGKWVKQGQERQDMLNGTYDALMDLSNITGVPPKALSLEGKLGFAFGANGRGKAMAHYEPGEVVINLTKTKGAGSLAHEWFHALDNYFQKKRDTSPSTDKGHYITHNPETYYVGPGNYTVSESRFKNMRVADESKWRKVEGVRPEVAESFKNLVDTLNGLDFAKRSSRLDKGKSNGYWSSNLEMAARAFESYVKAKMNANGYDNDFLANITNESGFAKDDDRFPYIKADEIAEVEAAFDDLFNTIESKETESGDVALFRTPNNTNPTTTGNRTSVSPADADKVINSIISSWTGGIKARRNEFVVAPTYDDLPSDIKDAAKKQGAEGKVYGVFHKGKTYVVLDKHNSTQELETTIFHETYGHHGMKKLFGKELTQKMNQLFAANGGISGLRKTAEKHGIDLSIYEKGVTQANYPQEVRNRVLMEELLAHMQQDNKPSVKRMAKEVVGYIRQKLRDLGFAKLANLSDSDLFYLLKQSRDAVRKGSVKDGEVRFMFGGQKAKLADKEALSKAQEMEGSGASREQIWQETGWWNDNGNWKFEINDNLAAGNEYAIGVDEAIERLRKKAKITESEEDLANYEEARMYQGSGLTPEGLAEQREEAYKAAAERAKVGGDYEYEVFLNDVSGIDLILAEARSRSERVDGFVDHSELYANYPDAGEMLAITKDDIYGDGEYRFIDPEENGRETVRIKQDAKSETGLSTLLHEIQHSIQRKEGFQTGANNDSDTVYRLKNEVSNRAFSANTAVYRAKDKVRELEQEGKEKTKEYEQAKENLDQALTEQIRISELEQKVYGMSNLEIYKLAAGEAEARLVQTRQKLTPEERKARPPWLDFDINEEDRIFRDESSDTAMFRTAEDSTPRATAPVEKRWSKDWFKRKLQDKFAPIKDMQASIEGATGEALPEDQDTYEAETRFYGKTEEDLRKLKQNHIMPLVDAMAQNNIEAGELDQYLMAKHAKERNKHIASINPEMPDGGSGMTNQEAADILSRYEQEGKLAGLSIAANEVYKITAKRRQLLRESGLEDEALLDVWDAGYQFYVPLKGFANDSEGSTIARTGKGFDIRGKESMKAMGRRTMAESPTAHAIQDLTETIIRARKNEVAKTFLNMVESNPNPEIWEVFTDENPDTERRMVNGEVKENQPVDMRYRKDDYFAVKVDGKTKYIKLKDKDGLLMEAMKNMGPAQVNGFTKAMGAATRWLSMVNTSLNPEFTVTNFTRDIQTALFNALAEQDLTDGKVKDKQIAGSMVKGTGKAVGALYKHARGKLDQNNPMYTWIEEFLADGAKTGYFDSKDVDQIGKDMSSLLDMTKGTNKGKLLKAKKTVGDFVENINGSIENGVRLSAYIEARRAGVTRNKAASFAKNLTVNFNRKGSAGTFLNSVYMFFNAAVQGNVNFARAILTPKVDEATGKKSLNKAQKIAAGIVGASFGWASLMREIGGEDEDGVPYWDKIPKGVRERSFVILKPGTDGEYFKIPLPYGYNIFYNIGDAMEAAVQSDTRTKGDLAAELALSAYASFIPLGSPVGDNEAESAALVATPTLFKPIVEIATNKNFFGGQIYRENMPYGPELRDSQMSMRSTGEMYKGIARWMNDVMGDGMKYKVDGEAPLYDISPDTIEHIVEFGLGGLYRFGSRMADTVGTVANGGDLDVTSTPFIRQVNGEIRPYEDISNFYDARQELKNIEAELKSRKGKARMEFMQEYRDKYRLRGLMSSVDKRMKLLRKQRDRIEIDDSLSFVEREERLQRIEDKMKSAVATFNEKWNETE